MRSAFLSLLASCALVSVCWAEEDPAAHAARSEALRRGLRSDVPADIANAAYAAGEEGLDDLVEDLLAVLDRYRDPEDGERGLVVTHVLDALIRLDARVPLSLLLREDGRYGAMRLILALRSGQAAHPFLRRVLAEHVSGGAVDAYGVAAGNVLAAAADAEMAALVLPHVRPELDVIVVDHDRPEIGMGFSCGHGTACRRSRRREGFPPRVWYTLSCSAGRDGVLLARGAERSAWYDRRVATSETFWRCSCFRAVDVTPIALAWVSDLLGVPTKGLALKCAYGAHHDWTDAAAYRAFVEKEREAIARDAEGLLDHLLSAGKLSPEAHARIEIRPRVQAHDNRDDRSTPIPKID